MCCLYTSIWEQTSIDNDPKNNITTLFIQFSTQSLRNKLWSRFSLDQGFHSLSCSYFSSFFLIHQNMYILMKTILSMTHMVACEFVSVVFLLNIGIEKKSWLIRLRFSCFLSSYHATKYTSKGKYNEWAFKAFRSLTKNIWLNAFLGQLYTCHDIELYMLEFLAYSDYFEGRTWNLFEYLKHIILQL